MSKKIIAGSRNKTSTTGRSHTKVIKMVKSEKTGAYSFREEMVPNDRVQDFFKK